MLVGPCVTGYVLALLFVSVSYEAELSCLSKSSISLAREKKNSAIFGIGVRAGGARGAAAPPNFGQLRFFGQHEKIWAKPVFKDVSMFLLLF